jgi:hypothetical protein
MEHLDLDGENEGASVATAPAVATARQRANAGNAKLAGNRAGTGNADKRTYNPDKLAENLAERILAGRGMPISPYAHASAPTEDDKVHIARITGIPAEEFQAKISARLQEIANKAGARIVEKLDEGGQKLSDLNMTLAISIDKIAAISGRTAQSGNVSVTVNNYGQMTREQMLAEVAKDAKPVIDV